MPFMDNSERKSMRRIVGGLIASGWIGIFTVIGIGSGYQLDKQSAAPMPGITEPDMERLQYSAERRGYNSLEDYRKELIARQVRAYEKEHPGRQVAGLGTLLCGVVGLAIGLASAPMASYFYKRTIEMADAEEENTGY